MGDISDATKRDVQAGIDYCDECEAELLEVEKTIRSRMKEIIDQIVPSNACTRIFEKRSITKTINSALSKIGDALGKYSATKRELEATLIIAQNDLFDKKAEKTIGPEIKPKIDPETGEVNPEVDPEILEAASKLQDSLPKGECVTMTIPGKLPVTVHGKGKPIN